MGFKITVDTNLIAMLSSIVAKTSNAIKSGLWTRITRRMKAIVRTIFDAAGGVFGTWKWLPIAKENYGHKRIGTDGGQYGRYSASSRPLIASGNYRLSHDMVGQPTPILMRFASKFPTDFVNLIQNAHPSGLPAARVAMPNVNDTSFNDQITRVNTRFMNDIMAEVRREYSIK